MTTADFLACLIKPYKTALVLACLLVFHPVEAKPNPPVVSKTVVPAPAPPKLILSLPEKTLEADNQKSFTESRDSNSLNGTKQIVIGGRKKSPLDVDCGVDVYKGAAPDTPLSRQLTGECDFKYHY